MSVTPVFVLGTFHSGTSILYHMLGMHPDATWLSQFSQRDGRIPGRRRLPFFAQVDHISRFVFEYDWQQSERRGLKRLIVSKPHEAQRVWQYVIPQDGIVNLELCADRMHRVLEEEERIWKRRSHILVKYPYLSRRVSILRRICPRAKFVHIIRDGRAVALSLQRHRIRKRFPDASPLDEIQMLENTARYWTEVLGGIDQESELIDLAEVRYEDFCTDVRGRLRELLKHIGLEVERFPFERCPSSLIPKNDRWIRSAPLEAIKTLEGIQETWLRKYGYL